MKRLFVVFFILNTIVFAVDFYNFGIGNGLPSENISHILEDKEGYIWIGTDRGLVRTDGEEFKVYKKDVFLKDSIKGDYINDIHINSNGEIVVISDSRFLNIYNKESDNFSSIDFGQELLLKKELLVYDSVDDKNGNIWIGTNAGLFCYKIKEKKVHAVERLINYEITQLALREQKLFLNTSKGILEYDLKEDSFDIPNFYHELKFKEVLNLTIEENYIKVITSDGIYSYDIRKKILIELYRAEKPIKIAYKSDFNTYYFIVENKLFKGNIRGKNFLISEIGILPNQLTEVSFIYKSSNNFIWLGSNKGLYFCNLDSITFNNQISTLGHIKAYYKNENNELISYGKEGLYLKNQFEEKKILEAHVTCIVGNKNRVYIGTKGQGIYSYDLEEKNLKKIETKNILDGIEINVMLLEKDTLFIGTRVGLYTIDKKNSKIEEYYFNFLSQKKYSQNIQKIQIDNSNKNKLWIGLWNGSLVELDLKTKEIDTFNKIFLKNGDIFYDNVSDFIQKENKIVIASNDAGLLILDKKTGIIKKTNIEIGENILNLVLDEENRIWLNTSTRIGYINSDFSSIKYYIEEDGINIGNLNKNIFTQGNMLYFIGEKGYLSFNPKIVKQNFDFSKINIEKVLYQNSQKYADLRYKNYIFVPYSEKKFKVYFKKLSFFGGQKGEYIYKLQGQDEKWNKLNSANEISFNNLKKGKYVLTIKTYMDNVELIEMEDSIIIYVEGNPFTSAGAIIIYIFVFGIVIFYIRKYNLEGYKLAFQMELNKFSTILNSSNNSKDLIKEFMGRSLNFLGIEDLELKIKENKQYYITTYYYEEFNEFVSENIKKDTDKVSLKTKKIGVTFELETDIINNIFLSRKIEEEKVYFYFDVKNKFSGIFSFKDTDDRLKQDKYFYKVETMIRQFLLSYKNLLTFEELARLANYDSLTNIYNRRYFDQLVKFNIEQSRRYNHKMTFAILDIDYFKKINDTHGHSVGDAILQGFVQRINTVIRDTDIFARFGGEEFVICFTETEKDKAFDVCERIREFIEKEPFEINDEKINTTVTIGLSEFSKEDTIDTMMLRADKALYKGKNAGRNMVVFKENDGNLKY